MDPTLATLGFSPAASRASSSSLGSMSSAAGPSGVGTGGVGIGALFASGTLLGSSYDGRGGYGQQHPQQLQQQRTASVYQGYRGASGHGNRGSGGGGGGGGGIRAGTTGTSGGSGHGGIYATTSATIGAGSAVMGSRGAGIHGALSFPIANGVFEVPSEFELTTIGQLGALFYGASLRVLLYNLVIGNQVVVRGAAPGLVASIIEVISRLLPSRCSSIIYFSALYEPRYRCSLLGVDVATQVPPVTADGDIVLFDLATRSSGSFAPTMVISVQGNGPYKITTLGARLEELLRRACSDRFRDMCLANDTEAWLHLATVFYRFARSSLADNPKLVTRFLRALSLHKNDLEVLRFWQTAVSSRARALQRTLGHDGRGQ
jgi:hypothetical protein